MTIVRDLVAARNTDFVSLLEIDYSGDALPLVGATATMEVRQYGGQAGPAIAQDYEIEIADAESGEAGVRTLSLSLRITRGVLMNLPTGLNEPEFGEADRFTYEIKMHYADGAEDSVLTGSFIVEPGVDRYGI